MITVILLITLLSCINYRPTIYVQKNHLITVSLLKNPNGYFTSFLEAVAENKKLPSAYLTFFNLSSAFYTHRREKMTHRRFPWTSQMSLKDPQKVLCKTRNDCAQLEEERMFKAIGVGGQMICVKRGV